MSADGNWAAWVVEPWDGDPTLVVSRTDGSASTRLRGRDPVFTRDSRHLAYRVPPRQSVVDALRREGKSDDELPGDSLGVLSLAALEASPDGEGAEFTAGPIESFQVPEDGGSWIAYHLSEDPAEAEPGEAGAETAGGGAGSSAGEAGEEAEEEAAAAEERSPEHEKRHEKAEGTPLVLRRLGHGGGVLLPACGVLSGGGQRIRAGLRRRRPTRTAATDSIGSMPRPARRPRSWRARATIARSPSTNRETASPS